MNTRGGVETLELQEYQTARGIRITPEQRDLLRKFVPDLKVSPTIGEQGVFDINPESWIGTCQLPGLNVLIHPKLPIARVLFMLTYTLDLWPDRQPPGDFLYDHDHDILEALAYVFGIALKKSLAGGLLQGYQTREEALQGVKGRLRFDEQLRRHACRFPPLECRYDEYTEDILENRLLKSAINNLGRMPIRSEVARRTLREFSTVFAHVSSQEYHSRQVPDIHYTRLNSRYRPALELARLILQAVSFRLSCGRISASTLLFDMNKVFEGFVVRALRETLRLSDRDFPQNCSGRELWFDEDLRVQLKPDISWWEHGRCLLVGDVKYKNLDDKQNADDLYQALAYCTATRLPNAFFIFAAGQCREEVIRVRHAGKSIDLLALNLDCPDKQVIAQIQHIASRFSAEVTSGRNIQSK